MIKLILLLTIVFIVLFIIIINRGWPKRFLLCSIIGILIFIAVCSLLTHSDSEECVEKKLICDEQKEYAIELIKIHEDFVDELSRGRLLIKQSFFLVVTGLLLYHIVKKNEKGKKPLLGKNQLIILLIFSTIICHFNEGILNYWQAEHLNKIYILEGALDSTVFPNWFENSHVYRYKDLPFSENQDFGVINSCISHILFTYSMVLNASSIAFYYMTLILVYCLVYGGIIKSEET